MKELSIEQKARRYDEALERAKELLEVGLKDTRDKRVVLSFFPELAESEDERIRKDIISYLKSSTAVSPKTWIEWLEKQGEQKPAVPKFRIGDKVKKDYLTYTVEDIDEDSYKLQAYSKDGNKGCTVFLTIGYEKDYELVEQKAEWSKEDEMDFDVIYGIIYNSCNAEDASRLIEWLKSLRPQNRCTYNPYKEVVESIAEMCEKYEDANLDSLKDFYSNVKVKCKDAKEYDSLFPQSTWKPSEEQMVALNNAILLNEDRYNGAVLSTLREQLKKLREE